MAKDTPAPVPPLLEQELGMLEVADEVFCDIAARALSQVKGVAVVGRSPSGLFRRGAGSQAVHVERGQGEVAFSVHLTVRYDVCIPTLMSDLHQRLTQAIEAATGYKVRSMNVTIDHILPPVPKLPEPVGLVPDHIPDLPSIPDRE